jgi:hypothetical protein
VKQNLILIVPQPEHTRTQGPRLGARTGLLRYLYCTPLTVRRSRSRSHRGAAAGRQHAAHNAPVDIGAVPAQLHGTPQAAQLLVTWDPDEG